MNTHAPLAMRAAVVHTVNQIAVETVTLDPPHANEVLVRMRAAGICHSDLHTMQGQMRAMPPLVLGHEGAGVVEAVGAAVTSVKPGDRVLINWMPVCRQCAACTGGMPSQCEQMPLTVYKALLPDGTMRLHAADGSFLKHYLSAATLAEFTVVTEAGVIPIPDGVPFDVAAIIGCAVVTGAGAVFNTAGLQPGQGAAAVAVIGCGGVGLSALLACVHAGCHPILAIDTRAEKLEFARTLGATHTLQATPGLDLAAAVRAALGAPPLYVFDSVGASATIGAALEIVAPGGCATVMGLHDVWKPAPISPAALVYQNKQLRGSYFGQADPAIDLPLLMHLQRSGALPVERLITQRYTLDEVPQALADLDAGRVLGRGVVIFDA